MYEETKPGEEEMMMSAKILAGIAEQSSGSLTVTLEKFSIDGEVKGDYVISVWRKAQCVCGCSKNSHQWKRGCTTTWKAGTESCDCKKFKEKI